MCGRFVQFSSLRTLESYFPIETAVDDIRSSYNIAPTQEVLAIVHQNERRLEKLRWGLVPSWSKDLKAASRLINARSETASQKPSFRAAFKRRRCLIVADGFYEWQSEKGRKQPYFISLPTKEPLGFAGLWEVWKPTDESKETSIYRSCTILTRAASKSVDIIHHRMPVILKAGAYNEWLDPANQDVEQLEDLLQHQHIREMQFHPVSKLVNRVQNNSEACISPLSENQPL
jgi:putative SOS response-associated peptidase YedK